MRRVETSELLEAQQNIIEKIALGEKLEITLNTICLKIESIINSPYVRSTILLLNGNILRHGAAPSIAKSYCDAIDGVEIGDGVGSCGTAAFLNQQVIVTDIENDPLWANFKSLALDHDLRACWSTPIMSSHNKVLGTFAIYNSKVATPNKEFLDLINHFTHLSSLAIEKVKIEKELVSYKKLESIGILAGGMAHDFNNILTGLFGNIELAKNQLKFDDPAYKYIETAHHAIDEAKSLTQQLLTFAEGGDPLLELIDIESVILHSIKLSLSGSNVNAILDLSENLWSVSADKGQLSQVINNIIINANQAMALGGNIVIKAENIEKIEQNQIKSQQQPFIKISITDEGRGISTSDLEKIFDPYFSTKQKGNGLGLASAQSIITKHGGYISVKSRVDVGTTFYIYLPAERISSQSKAKNASIQIKTTNASAGHVLIMDDNEMILSLSSDMIDSFGYTVDTAIDGKEAIAKYIVSRENGKPFDVVIMDLTIPGGMGGKEAVNRLLELDPQAKVIVSSGYSNDPIMANYLEYGFQDRLIKPFKMNELEKVLTSVLRS